MRAAGVIAAAEAPVADAAMIFFDSAFARGSYVGLD
jgi:hypothetical protein